MTRPEPRPSTRASTARSRFPAAPSLTLNPGVYVITGGGLSVTGSASIIGNGVMIYNAGSTYPNAGGTYGGITLNTTGAVTCLAPATGPDAGILFFQARTNPTGDSISGGSSVSLSGIIYAVDAILTLSGSVQLNDALVVNRLQISGSAGETIVGVYPIHGTSSDVESATDSIESTSVQTASVTTPSPSPTPAVSLVTVLTQVGQSTSLTSTNLTGTTTGADDGETEADGQPSFELLANLASVPGQADESTLPTIEIAPTATVPQAVSSETQPAGDNQADAGDTTVVQGADLDDEDRFRPARAWIGVVSDAVLDDLAAGFVPRRGPEADRAAGGPGLVAIGTVEHRTGRGVTRVSDPRLTTIPAGPLPHQGRPGQSVESKDLLLAAGFCGLGAGMMAVESQRVRNLSPWRKFLRFRP